MTDTTTPADGQGPAPSADARPPTAAEAVKSIAAAAAETRKRAALIRQAPELHRPKLVLSEHVRGDSVLDKIAEAVNKFCGSMWVFMAITLTISSEEEEPVAKAFWPTINRLRKVICKGNLL